MKTRKNDLKNKIHQLEEVVAMKCLDCVCCFPKEIKQCQIKDCPLWNERPTEIKGLYILAKRLKGKNITLSEAK